MRIAVYSNYAYAKRVFLFSSFFLLQDDDMSFNPAPASKQKDAPKEEPADNSPMKPASSASARGTSTASKSAKGKRKANGDDTKASNGTPLKKVKSETVCY